jgi:Xaa-Pro aminopeptidase
VDFADRLRRARAATAAAGVDALLIGAGADLRYLTGYPAHNAERLTCLVLPAAGDPVLVVPRLERPAALASPVGPLGLEVLDWADGEDPYGLVAERFAGPVRRVAVDDYLHAAKVLALRAALPDAEQVLAGPVLGPLRARKAPDEVAALRAAGAAIDRVHDRMAEWLRPGRTERAVGRDIAEAILAEGHQTADFTIVASGPNGASPHHELSDRVIRPGDPVVVDIGGTMPSGYCSDETRVYAVGEAPADFRAYYAVLQEAQAAARAAVRPGVTPEAVDAAARDVIAAAGHGAYFIHRTGHGIGLETHEEPYIVSGNTEPLEAGMAFSIEPGIYPGAHGARIEDIVVCTPDGHESVNNVTRDLVIVDA